MSAVATNGVVPGRMFFIIMTFGLFFFIIHFDVIKFTYEYVNLKFDNKVLYSHLET